MGGIRMQSGTAISNLIGDKKKMLEQRGQCATFFVCVRYRQNATWQGTLVWKEKEREVEFRSCWTAN